MCSDEFAALARAESQVLGLGALPLVAVPHPLAGNDAALVAAKGRAIAAEIEHVLTTPAEALAADYGGRFLALAERRLQRGALCVDAVCALDPGANGDAR